MAALPNFSDPSHHSLHLVACEGQAKPKLPEDLKEYFDAKHAEYMRTVVSNGNNTALQAPSWKEAFHREAESEVPTGDFETFFAAGHINYLAETYEEHLFLNNEEAWAHYARELIWLRWSHRHMAPEIAPPDHLHIASIRNRVKEAFAPKKD